MNGNVFISHDEAIEHMRTHNSNVISVIPQTAGKKRNGSQVLSGSGTGGIDSWHGTDSAVYKDDKQQYFPAFSFCNLSPLRFDQFIKPFLNYTNTLNLTNINDTTTFIPYQASLI
ncbi:unnamed protein product, partial [Didymodactylos carnosus]